MEPVTCKTALNRTGIPGHRYCLNPYTGCLHGCVYCYAPSILRFSPVADAWGTRVQAKVNIPAVLSREVSRRRTPVGDVMLASVTDAYQPCERDLALTRQCLEVLSVRPDAGVSILTKSALVTRDIDVLLRWRRPPPPGARAGAAGRTVSVGFSITVLDDGVARCLEPGASPPSQRLEAARRLVQAGIPVWVFVAPVLPGLGDSPQAVRDLLRALRNAGVREVIFDRLNPYPRSVANLRALYGRRFPRAVGALEGYLRHPGAYWQEFLTTATALAAGEGLEVDL